MKVAPRRRGAPLTEAGRMVLARAESLLKDAACLREAARVAAGHATVRLAAVEPVASRRLPPLMAAFSRQRPEIHIELRIAGQCAASALVESGAVAYALTGKPATSRRAGTPSSFTHLYDDPMIVLLPERLGWPGRSTSISPTSAVNRFWSAPMPACIARSSSARCKRATSTSRYAHVLAIPRRSPTASPPGSASPFFPPVSSPAIRSPRVPSRDRCAGRALPSESAFCNRDGATEKRNPSAPSGAFCSKPFAPTAHPRFEFGLQKLRGSQSF